VSHVQMQCTIALVSYAQTEGKVSVSLHLNHDCHTMIYKRITIP